MTICEWHHGGEREEDGCAKSECRRFSYGERAVLAKAEMAVVRVEVPATVFRNDQNKTCATE